MRVFLTLSYIFLHLQTITCLQIISFLYPYSKLFEEGYGEERFSLKKFLPIILSNYL